MKWNTEADNITINHTTKKIWITVLVTLCTKAHYNIYCGKMQPSFKMGQANIWTDSKYWTQKYMVIWFFKQYSFFLLTQSFNFHFQITYLLVALWPHLSFAGHCQLRSNIYWCSFTRTGLVASALHWFESPQTHVHSFLVV